MGDQIAIAIANDIAPRNSLNYSLASLFAKPARLRQQLYPNRRPIGSPIRVGASSGRLPANPQPASISFSTIPGVYSNPGYGNVTLTELSQVNATVQKLIISTLNSLYLPADAQNATNAALGDVYVGLIDKSFWTHLMFTHNTGDYWNFTGAYWRPQTETFEWRTYGTAVINADGFGMFSDFWGQGYSMPLVNATTDDPASNSEAWFQRVGNASGTDGANASAPHSAGFRSADASCSLLILSALRSILCLI